MLIIDGAIFGDALGGSYRFSYGVAKALCARGNRVTLAAPNVTRRREPISVEGRLTIARYECGVGPTAPYIGNWSLIVDTVRYLREVRAMESFDVVWAHTPVAAAALRLSGWRVPFIWTVHGPSVLEAEFRGSVRWPKRLALTTVERIGAASASLLTFASEYMRSICLPLLGGDKLVPKTVVLPLGLDVRYIASVVDSNSRISRKGDKPVRLVTVRRLDPRMGLDILIQAVSILRSRGLSVVLDIVGEGPEYDTLSDQIRHLGLEQNVRLRGRLADEEVFALYRVSYAAVLPSRDLEGFGLSMVEAMAAGVPPVVTPVGAMPEILSKDFPALIARGRDPEDLADAVIELIGLTTKEYDELCSRVRAFADRFDWYSIAPVYEQVLRETASRSSREVG